MSQLRILKEYMCVDGSYTHRFGTNLFVTLAAVLIGPVLCSWMLLATLMWPSMVLLRALTAPAFAMLLQFP